MGADMDSGGSRLGWGFWGRTGGPPPIEETYARAASAKASPLGAVFSDSPPTPGPRMDAAAERVPAEGPAGRVRDHE